MNEKELEDLIRQSYSTDRFCELLRSIFSGNFSEELSDYEGASNEQEKRDIDSYKILGTLICKDNKEIGFFEFKCKKDISKPKVKLYNIMKKKTGEMTLDGAICAFYQSNTEIWRLSFIRFAYDQNHKVYSTNPKRYTYLLGQDMLVKTAHSQLKSLLEANPNLEQLQKAFSIEAVTKYFYKGIVEFYDNLKKNMKYPRDQKDKQEFIIRTLARVIFIKFLVKKGVIGDDIFKVDNSKDTNYYHEKLEPLFFEQLNKEHSNRIDKYKTSPIPYLNGGLFENLKLDYYDIDEELEVSRYFNTLCLPNDSFKNLYKHLDKFNWTCDEASSYEVELSIDPQMLGMILENLLSSMTSKDGSNKRKQTGATTHQG